MLNRDTYALYLAYQDPKTPVSAKVIGIATLIYLFIPADIVPDIIPILGWADDITVTYLLSKFAVSIIPPDIMAQHRAVADRKGKKIIQVIIAIMILLFIAFLGLAVLLFSALLNW